jgi:hypothetical protein
MLKRVLLSSFFAASLAGPAVADTCSEPLPPVAVDGSMASEAQMKSAHDDVMSFIKSSDDYQECLNADLTAQKLQAKKDKKPLDPSATAGVADKLQKNQAIKEKVGGEYNTAVAAYKAKHP